MTDRPLIIVNPQAGAGRAGQGLDAFLDVVRGALGEIDVALTERPLHATQLAEEAAAQGRTKVVATGGDGSVHEVACGLLAARKRGFDQAALGIIGRGTGGDFCRTLGIEHRLDRYLAVIASGQARKIDVGRIRYQGNDGSDAEGYFVNILSAGMGGLVDRYVHRHTKWAGGKLAYFVASAQALKDSALSRLRVTSEYQGETRVQEVLTRQIAICNGRYFGSGMFIAPMAEVDDGTFEVVDLGSAGKLKFALAGSAVYSGAHLRSPDVSHFRCNKIRLEPLGDTDQFPLDIDGESPGFPPVEIECLPRELPVLLLA